MPLSLNDLIYMEHNYCRRIVMERPELSPLTAGGGKRKRQPKTATAEPKRKRKKKDEIITDENITPSVLAVASEWRKAKRKS
ncbi:hypothetical protein BLA29_015079, partial [Euroglyphus maynei]